MCDWIIGGLCTAWWGVDGMLVILLCELRFCWFVYECYDGLNL